MVADDHAQIQRFTAQAGTEQEWGILPMQGTRGGPDAGHLSLDHRLSRPGPDTGFPCHCPFTL